MRTARALALVGVAAALAGCGASASEQVQAKLQQFAHAVATRNPQTLCGQVLAPELVNHLTAAGITCQAAMRVFVEGVTDPTISVTHVRVRGTTASAVVLAGAKGQAPSLERVDLRQTARGWRLTSLASPR